MQYAIIQNGQITGQADDAHGNVRWDANHFCTPSALTASEQVMFGVIPLTLTMPPSFNPMSQYAPVEAQPVLVAGVPTQQWSVPASLPLDVAAGLQLSAALGAGITITSTGTPALNGLYSCDQQAQDNASAIAASIGSGQGLPGGGTDFAYLDSTSTPHTFTQAQFLTLADAIRNYVYSLDITAAQSAAGQTVTWPTASATIP